MAKALVMGKKWCLTLYGAPCVTDIMFLVKIDSLVFLRVMASCDLT